MTGPEISARLIVMRRELGRDGTVPGYLWVNALLDEAATIMMHHEMHRDEMIEYLHHRIDHVLSPAEAGRA